MEIGAFDRLIPARGIAEDRARGLGDFEIGKDLAVGRKPAASGRGNRRPPVRSGRDRPPRRADRARGVCAFSAAAGERGHAFNFAPVRLLPRRRSGGPSERPGPVAAPLCGLNLSEQRSSVGVRGEPRGGDENAARFASVVEGEHVLSLGTRIVPRRMRNRASPGRREPKSSTGRPSSMTRRPSI